MKKPLLLFSAVLISQAVFGLRWPVNNPVILKSFGQLEENSFITSISIVSEDGNVYSIADGITVYLRVFPGEDPKDNLLILEHDNGLRSIYRNFFPLDDFPDTVSEGQLIGSGKNIKLEILDTEGVQIVNPEILLPFLEDKAAPRIEGIFILSDNRELTRITGRTVTTTGSKTVLAEIFDERSGNRLIPFKIKYYVDGIKYREYVFESLKYQNDAYNFSWAEKADKIFVRIDDVIYINLGELQVLPGEVRLEIYAEDIRGNISSVNLSITGIRPN